MRKPFGQLSIGSEFEYAGKSFIKLDDFNARTTVSRGKEFFLFFKRDLVTIKSSSSIFHSDILSDKSTFVSVLDKAMIEGYKDFFDRNKDDNFVCNTPSDPETIEEPKE